MSCTACGSWTPRSSPAPTTSIRAARSTSMRTAGRSSPSTSTTAAASSGACPRRIASTTTRSRCSGARSRCTPTSSPGATSPSAWITSGTCTTTGSSTPRATTRPPCCGRKACAKRTSPFRAALTGRPFSCLRLAATRHWPCFPMLARPLSAAEGYLHPARHWLMCMTLLCAALAARAAESSEPAPLAAKSLLLDVARAGDRLVAVGDRGHVLLSDDEGQNWRQVVVPTRAMLTGVSFGDPQHGWAVGHDGVILATADGGATWVHQDATKDLETIFLDVFFSDPQHGLAVGAYGKCLLTLDGGKSWQPGGAIPDEVHVNQIAPTQTDTVWLAGEAGTLLSSSDARQAWTKCIVPYEGSLFGALPLGDHSLLIYGLRGHAFVTTDDGA